jgi:hypothetical protein
MPGRVSASAVADIRIIVPRAIAASVRKVIFMAVSSTPAPEKRRPPGNKRGAGKVADDGP